ncbi:MAG: hypothetical protein JO100_00445 [Pseudonocardia sp.]|nr:hypothetical protein [Pseudonocardia sp.]
MKYRTASVFDRDFARLPPGHRAMFLTVLREHFLPAIAAGAFAGTPPWPRRLRLHRLTDSGIYSLTWNFSSPDGRATFHLERTAADEPLLVWRRVGDHTIYNHP